MFKMINSIAIIYYSYTGHTKKVAEIISHKLKTNNVLNVQLTALETISRLDFNAEMVPIKSIPNIDNFDFVILGSPVHGGRISAPIMTFLQESEDLPGKSIILLLTHFFKRGRGADQALERFKSLCINRGMNFRGMTSVKWKWLSLQRKKAITQAIDDILGLINGE